MNRSAYELYFRNISGAEALKTAQAAICSVCPKCGFQTLCKPKIEVSACSTFGTVTRRCWKCKEVFESHAGIVRLDDRHSQSDRGAE